MSDSHDRVFTYSVWEGRDSVSGVAELIRRTGNSKSATFRWRDYRRRKTHRRPFGPARYRGCRNRRRTACCYLIPWCRLQRRAPIQSGNHRCISAGTDAPAPFSNKFRPARHWSGACATDAQFGLVSTNRGWTSKSCPAPDRCMDPGNPASLGGTNSPPELPRLPRWNRGSGPKPGYYWYYF